MCFFGCRLGTIIWSWSHCVYMRTHPQPGIKSLATFRKKQKHQQKTWLHLNLFFPPYCCVCCLVRSCLQSKTAHHNSAEIQSHMISSRLESRPEYVMHFIIIYFVALNGGICNEQWAVWNSVQPTIQQLHLLEVSEKDLQVVGWTLFLPVIRYFFLNPIFRLKKKSLFAPGENAVKNKAKRV